jgi:hypothetical protein
MITKIKSARKSATEPAFPEITEENFKGELEVDGIVLLEKGMASGKTSVGIKLKDKEGKYYMTQMSLEQFHYITSAAKGSEEFWKNNPE